MKTEAECEAIKTAYREETGEELPDHVVENLDVLIGNQDPRYPTFDSRLMRDDQPYGAAEEDDDTSAAELVFTLAWTAGTGLAALYATQFIAGTGAQIVGGVLLWVVLFSVPMLVAEATKETAKGWFGA